MRPEDPYQHRWKMRKFVRFSVIGVFVFASSFLLETALGQYGTRSDHTCRILGDNGCDDTGPQRCQAMFNPTDGSTPSCFGDCFVCGGSDAAGASVCVYVEGSSCSKSNNQEHNPTCGGPNQTVVEIGFCGDPFSETGEGVDGDECTCIFMYPTYSQLCRGGLEMRLCYP